MKLINLSVVPLAFCWQLAAALPPTAFAQAEIPTGSSSAQSTQAGLRVSYQSYYTAEIEAVIKAAETAGKVKGYSRAKAADNAFPSHLSTKLDFQPEKKAALEMGETDALVFGMWWTTGGSWESSMNDAAKWGMKNNPTFRVLWQTHWALLLGRYDDLKKQNFQAPDVLKPHYDTFRKKVETQVDSVNKQHGRRVVVIVPVTDAVLKLRALVAEGKFPGVSEQSELFVPPGTWDAHRHIRMLTAYCNFVALYGVSPEGFSPAVDHLNYKAKGGPAHSMAGITAEQHTILQKIAWETVSNYPYAGLAEANGKTPQDEAGVSP